MAVSGFGYEISLPTKVVSDGYFVRKEVINWLNDHIGEGAMFDYSGAWTYEYIDMYNDQLTFHTVVFYFRDANAATRFKLVWG